MKRFIAIISILLLCAVTLHATTPAETRCASTQTCIQPDIHGYYTIQDVLTQGSMQMEWHSATTDTQTLSCEKQGVAKTKAYDMCGTLPQRYRQLKAKVTTVNARMPYYHNRISQVCYRSPSYPPDASRARKK